MKALEQKVADSEKELLMIRNRSTSSNPISLASVPSTLAINTSISQRKNTDVCNDRKFNLVIYGIPEFSSSSKRFERLQLDQRNVLKELSNLDNSINSSCIEDTLRLGEYNKDSNTSRPILVKLVRSSDVQCILSEKLLEILHVYQTLHDN